MKDKLIYIKNLKKITKKGTCSGAGIACTECILCSICDVFDKDGILPTDNLIFKLATTLLENL